MKTALKSLTRQEILAQRFANQGLISAYQNAEELLEESLGIQSQYLNHGLFNLFHRLIVPKGEQVEETLKNTILAWGQRQTYHFYSFNSWQKISQFLSEEKLWVEDYFQAENLDLAKETQRLKGYLKKPILRKQLAETYGDDWAKLFLWSALFLHQSRKGHLYQKWLPHDREIHWTENKPAFEDDLAKELLTRYFCFYGPACLADAAHFFGIRQSKINEADLEHLEKYDYKGTTYYACSQTIEANIPEVLVLGKFDPLLVSYKKKDLLIPQEQQGEVWKKAGQISAIILIKGVYRANWTFSVKGQSIEFSVTSTKKIAKTQQATITRQFRRYANWIGKNLHKVEFEVMEKK